MSDPARQREIGAAIADATLEYLDRYERRSNAAGGADAPLTKHGMASFIATGLSSFRNGEPEKASRPFDLERDTGVISEGAGMFILEDFERAQARGARIYLELSGYATQRDRAPEDPRGIPPIVRSGFPPFASAVVEADDIEAVSLHPRPPMTVLGRAPGRSTSRAEADIRAHSADKNYFQRAC